MEEMATKNQAQESVGKAAKRRPYVQPQVETLSGPLATLLASCPGGCVDCVDPQATGYQT